MSQNRNDASSSWDIKAPDTGKTQTAPSSLYPTHQELSAIGSKKPFSTHYGYGSKAKTTRAGASKLDEPGYRTIAQSSKAPDVSASDLEDIHKRLGAIEDKLDRILNQLTVLTSTASVKYGSPPKASAPVYGPNYYDFTK